MKKLLLITSITLTALFTFSGHATEQHSVEEHGEHEKEGAHDHDQVHEEHGQDSGHDDEHAHEEEKATRIDDEMAARVGVETAKASSRILNQGIVAYGSLMTGPEQLSHVRARYSGMIKSVKRTLGDKVKPGDLLAQVESNDSLKTYSVRAPIPGIVIQRHANSGEVTQEQILFSIANFDTLWAEFRIYPTQQSLVKAGQPVRIMVNDLLIKGSIEHIIPVLDKPYQLARVIVDNQALHLSPGLLAEGNIVVATFSAKLAVDKNAIQNMGEQSGVFIKQGAEYIFAPLKLGRSDDRYVEVLSGLSTGQDYVSKNSYLIKADIEKPEAEHEH